MDFNVNTEKVEDLDAENAEFCYCNKSFHTENIPYLPCVMCLKSFHQSCIKNMQNWSSRPLFGDIFYHFICLDCSKDKIEQIKRYSLSWAEVVHLALINLSILQPKPLIENKSYYHYKTDICNFIESNWDRFWCKPQTAAWKASVASILSTSPKFVNSTGLWALANDAVLDPPKNNRPTFSILPDGSFVEDLKKPVKKKVDDCLKKKRSLPKIVFQQQIDPENFTTIYPDIENPPLPPVFISSEPTHTAPQVKVSGDGLMVTNESGYRMAKATHGVWEGSWYFEVKITNDVGNARYFKNNKG